MSTGKVDPRLITALFTFGLDLATAAIERRSQRKLTEMTPEEVLAAIRAEQVASADDLINRGIGPRPSSSDIDDSTAGTPSPDPEADVTGEDGDD
jgi:hypothetical protein